LNSIYANALGGSILRIRSDSYRANPFELRRTDWDEPAGALSVIPVDEASIEPEDRIPRVTSANWKYASGAVGSLTHMLVLQGYRYSCELEVCKQSSSVLEIYSYRTRSYLSKIVLSIDADGYQLKLIDPYGNPELRVRTPTSDEEHVYSVCFRSFALESHYVLT